jgi:hypothetical protein
MITEKRYFYIDPPSGWRYGFPVKMEHPVTAEKIAQVLEDHDYPVGDRNFAQQYLRVWEAVPEENDK